MKENKTSLVLVKKKKKSDGDIQKGIDTKWQKAVTIL